MENRNPGGKEVFSQKLQIWGAQKEKKRGKNKESKALIRRITDVGREKQG